MARTLGEQLDTIQTAIEALESGKAQSYEIEGRKMTYFDLRTLYDREEKLISKISRLGRNYTLGQETEAIKTRAKVVFYD